MQDGHLTMKLTQVDDGWYAIVESAYEGKIFEGRVTELSDLLVGNMRIRKSGGSGGHNGLNSINRDLTTQDYPRLRIGISRPAHGAIEHVLGGFTPAEQGPIDEALAQAIKAVEAWVAHGTDFAMNNFN